MNGDEPESTLSFIPLPVLHTPQSISRNPFTFVYVPYLTRSPLIGLGRHTRWPPSSCPTVGVSLVISLLTGLSISLIICIISLSISLIISLILLVLLLV